MTKMSKYKSKSKKMETKVKRLSSEDSYKTVICSKCNRMPMKIEITSKSGICWLCTTRMVEPPTLANNKPTGRPRGWQFRHEYVDKDGNVFHKGEEQASLKGTKSPTKLDKKITVKKKIDRKQRIDSKTEIGAEIYKLKNKLNNAKTKKEKILIERKIKKLQKTIK